MEKVKNSEFLTLNEALKVKVYLIMIFLLFFGLLTIPISFFIEDLALSLRIVVPLVYVSLFGITFIMLMLNRSRIAMHFSMYTFIGLTIYYVSGTGQLYGYFLFFITLTVIIFYQDITTYILYGGILTAYGVYYIQASESLLVDPHPSLPQVGPAIYQAILIGFFLVYLIQFILTDSINENLNQDYIRTKKTNNRYKSYLYRYITDLENRDGFSPIQDNPQFHITIKEISKTIIEEGNFNIEDDFEEVIEFYFFLHRQDIQKILKRDKIAEEVKTYAYQFQKYLINSLNELDSLLFRAVCHHKEGIKDKLNRYEYRFDTIFSNKTNRILGLAIMYKFLTTEITQLDKWGRVQKVLSHQELKALFQSKEIREILSFEDINFFLKNENFFKDDL